MTGSQQHSDILVTSATLLLRNTSAIVSYFEMLSIDSSFVTDVSQGSLVNILHLPKVLKI